jgi:hypothetical protein
MSNMSYCRFENTVYNLRDCYDNLANKLSKDENCARRELIEMCFDIVKECMDNQCESNIDNVDIDECIKALENDCSCEDKDNS